MLMPDLFIVPLGMGTDLRTILYSPTIHTPDNTQAVNPYLGMNFTVVEDTTSVSYTHLDVYKRQPQEPILTVYMIFNQTVQS